MHQSTLEARRKQARALAERHGATITQRGNVWRVRGPTVDVLLVELGSLSPSDFHTRRSEREPD